MCDACNALAIKVSVLLGAARVTLANEKATQGGIEHLLFKHDLPYLREYRLDADNIVDFLIADHLALEVKLRYPRREIMRQLTRYAAFDDVHVLILASNTAMALPLAINGKALINVSLGKGWL